MVVKTVVMLSLFVAPITLICCGIVSNPIVLFTLYVVSGFGMAGIGFGIMHDANHGTYSKSRTINTILGYTLNLVGSNAKIWKLQHNVLHHTYTNVDDVDDDINVPFFLRVSPNAVKRPIHRFQKYYFWFFYGLITLSWVTIKDFDSLSRYKKMGLLGGKFSSEILKVALWKLIYYSYVLVIPIIILPFAPWLIVLAFLSMHFISGLLISLVFQVAHIVPSTEFPSPDDKGYLSNEWAIHQLITTSNFSPNNKLVTWLFGGLNYQVEHHLFPNICHVHYPAISEIVKKTALEFNLPYNSAPTFVNAIIEHVKLIDVLGRAPQAYPLNS